MSYLVCTAFMMYALLSSICHLVSCTKPTCDMSHRRLGTSNVYLHCTLFAYTRPFVSDYTCVCSPGRPVHGSPGLPHLPQLRRRHRLRVRFAPHGASFGRLRQEVETRVRHLPSATGTGLRVLYATLTRQYLATLALN